MARTEQTSNRDAGTSGGERRSPGVFTLQSSERASGETAPEVFRNYHSPGAAVLLRRDHEE